MGDLDSTHDLPASIRTHGASKGGVTAGETENWQGCPGTALAIRGLPTLVFVRSSKLRGAVSVCKEGCLAEAVYDPAKIV